MNENSPTWASPSATTSAVRTEYPSSATTASAASGLPISTTASAASSSSGSRTRNAGSNSIPTETKNSTAKASRSGSASAAACWLTGDWPTTIPARNAPSAIEAPNSSAAPVAIAIAIARIVSVKSSRDCRRAT